MINKNIEEITKEDLQALIANSVLERKTLEYKKFLPGNSDAEKKEFLADVTSLANASGGDLIFGIGQDSETGVPRSLEGLTIPNIDEEKNRLDNIIRNGVQPRLPNVHIKEIPLENTKVALMIRVRKSWIAPHRVTFSGHDKFYSRNSSGKYPLDVGELRIAFGLTETTLDKIRNFRQEQISKALVNETPVTFHNYAKILLHLIPASAFNPTQFYSVESLSNSDPRLRPIYCGGWNNRINLDGYLSYAWNNEEKNSHSYVQIYRNGIIEAVEGLLLEPSEKKLIPSIAYEKELIFSLNEYLSILKSLKVELPIFTFLTLINVKGYSMAVRNFSFYSDRNQIERDILIVPETIIENYDTKSEIILKPLFDSIWNACGYPKDPYYNTEGKWTPRE